MSERSSWQDLRGAFTAYARGRQALLDAIGLGASNRDPLSDFSEQLVAALLEGELAKNRVQRGCGVMVEDRCSACAPEGPKHPRAEPGSGWVHD